MSLRKVVSFRAISMSLWAVLLLAGLCVVAVAQDDESAPPPPPPPGGPGGPVTVMTMQGPGFAAGFFHEDLGEGRRVVTGAPLTATISRTRDTTLADGNTIHTENESTIYRDSQGRVRRENQIELVTPRTGATKRSMVVIMDPVAGKRYVLNPQNKTAHEMPLHHPVPAAAAAMPTPEGVPARPFGGEVSTEQLGSKTILGLPAQGTRVTRTIPAGQIGNAKPIEVVTERWVSTDLQIPLLTIHSDPMMGTMTTKVTNVTRGEPDASLFQVPSDYKVETHKPGDMMYMKVKP